jgi:hypothetical protein
MSRQSDASLGGKLAATEDATAALHDRGEPLAVQESAHRKQCAPVSGGLTVSALTERCLIHGGLSDAGRGNSAKFTGVPTPGGVNP